MFPLAEPKLTCDEPLNAPIALPIVAADIVPPNDVDVPAIVIALFVKPIVGVAFSPLLLERVMLVPAHKLAT
jgi:hypothetical protein